MALIVAIGLLNFHPPHFLIESRNSGGGAGATALEVALLLDLVAAVVAAAGIHRDQGWGWRLGIAVAGIGVIVYVLQETVGLPDLPKHWTEPSRLLTLALEVCFLTVAGYQTTRSRTRGGPA